MIPLPTITTSSNWLESDCRVIVPKSTVCDDVAEKEIVFVVYPTKVITTSPCVFDVLMLNLPSMSVEAPSPVPLTVTLAAGNEPFISESTIVPVIFVCENAVDTEKISSKDSMNCFRSFILLVG
ncbi:hypothetical protein D9M72_327380 [compost metagenome]